MDIVENDDCTAREFLIGLRGMDFASNDVANKEVNT